MRQNKNVRPTRANSAPMTGNKAPYANMPANNNGTFKVKLGAGQNSKFGNGVKPGTAQKAATQHGGPKANMPASNNNTNMPALGNTKHGVGEVPGYLRHKK